MGEYLLSVVDYSKEISHFNTHLGPVNAATITGITGQLATLQSAVDGIILGVLKEEEFLVDRNRLSGALPASKNAQRENKWLVVYHDTVTFEVFKLQIPTADLSLVVNNSDFADITAGAMATFVTAFQDVAVSKSGNDVLIDYIKFVGRNL